MTLRAESNESGEYRMSRARSPYGVCEQQKKPRAGRERRGARERTDDQSGALKAQETDEVGGG